MAIGDAVKKIFKKDTESEQASASTAEAVEGTANAKAQKKPKHGEDGVCCGGCS